MHDLTRATTLWPEITPEQQFCFKSPLLRKSLGIGDGSGGQASRIAGRSYCTLSRGNAILTYLVTAALGIRRFPLCEDRIMTMHDKPEDWQALTELPEHRVDELIDEVAQLYHHTQSMLANTGKSHVVLSRYLRSSGPEDDYTQRIIEAKLAAQVAREDTVQLELDTLSSFSDEGAYHGEIQIVTKIPSDRVLTCYRLIQPEYEGGYPSELVEHGEWIILNPARNGVVSLPVSDIHIHSKQLQHTKPFGTPQEAMNHLLKHDPVPRRPRGWLFEHRENQRPEYISRRQAHTIDRLRHWIGV